MDPIEALRHEWCEPSLFGVTALAVSHALIIWYLGLKPNRVWHNLLLNM